MKRSVCRVSVLLLVLPLLFTVEASAESRNHKRWLGELQSPCLLDSLRGNTNSCRFNLVGSRNQRFLLYRVNHPVENLKIEAAPGRFVAAAKTPDERFFGGFTYGRHGARQRMAASFSNKVFRVHWRRRGAVYGLRARLTADGLKVTRRIRVPSYIKLPCGIPLSQAAHGGYGNGGTPPLAYAVNVGKTETINVVADKEYNDKFSPNTASEISDVFNQVAQIYARDLGITIQVQNALILTTSSGLTSTDSSTLLTQFTSFGADQSPPLHNSANLAHLLTGKNLDSNIIGLAYLGVVCIAPTFSYGLAQDVFSGALTPLVSAHELGHNNNATHYDVPQSIMAPAVSSSNDTFLSFSQNEIFSFLSANGSCLGSGGGSPTPTPTPNPGTDDLGTLSATLTAKFRTSSKSGKEKLSIGVTLSGSGTCSSGPTVAVYGSNKESKLDSSVIETDAIFLTRFSSLTDSVKETRKIGGLPATDRRRKARFKAVIECGSLRSVPGSSLVKKTRDGGNVKAKKVLNKASPKFAKKYP